MVALLLVLSILSWVLLAFFLMLVARFVLSLIVMFAPQWHPKGPLLLLFEGSLVVMRITERRDALRQAAESPQAPV